ncbi:Imipenem-hydrolyzing beta-lactamase [Trichinella spiralis]|uniref:Imipenem-hydrolyzing beta-lactamase n=1 Tax=Trichinella spiralis TaxID=6334 RepID=A0ABR3K6E9_TRISP
MLNTSNVQLISKCQNQFTVLVMLFIYISNQATLFNTVFTTCCSIRGTVAALLLHKGTRHVVNYNSLLQYCLRISGNIKFHLPADVYLFIPNKLRPNNRRGLESQCILPPW